MDPLCFLLLSLFTPVFLVFRHFPIRLGGGSPFFCFLSYSSFSMFIGNFTLFIESNLPQTCHLLRPSFSSTGRLRALAAAPVSYARDGRIRMTTPSGNLDLILFLFFLFFYRHLSFYWCFLPRVELSSDTPLPVALILYGRASTSFGSGPCVVLERWSQ